MRKLLLFLAFTTLIASYGVRAEQPLDPLQQEIAKLSDKDPQVRRRAAEALGQMKNMGAVDALLKSLSDPVPTVKSAVIESLGLMRVQSAGPAIAKILETDKDPSLRQISAISLGYIANRETVPSLIKGISDPHEGTRFASINSLGILRDGNAVEPLAKELKNPDARMRSSSAYALGNIGDKTAAPYLLEALKISRSTEAVSAPKKSTETAGVSQSSAPSKAANEFFSPAVGASAVRSLGLIGDASAVPELKAYLNDTDKKVKMTTAWSLSKLGDRSGLTAARQLLNDADNTIRRYAAEVLGDLGEAADGEKLKKMSGDPDRGVQMTVQQAIEKISRRTAVKPKPSSMTKTKAATAGHPAKANPAAKKKVP